MPRQSHDGNKLAADVARLRAADKMSPPTARPSLMDAVRALATFIDTRAQLGWTDAMIAALLTEAGYPISAGTLRSYRKRLRDEGRLAPKDVRSQSAAGTATAISTAMTAVAPADAARNQPPQPAQSAPEPANLHRDPAPPATHAPQRRSFAIDPTKLPPEEA